MMKHVTRVTRVPAKAFLPINHPSILDSISGFLSDPVGTLMLHFDKTSQG